MKVNISEKLDKKTYSAISDCIEIADKFGVEIYLVGGIVRDILLENPIKDVDITVVGDARDFVKLLETHCSLEKVVYNQQLPNAKVVFKSCVEIDFASTREEVYEFDGALPKAVKIGCSLEKDILRRDFTINTLVVSLNKKNLFEVIDFLGGIDDLQKKQLKVLHQKSYYDDPSRIIRCLKFALRLGFSIEHNTFQLQQNYVDNPLVGIPLKRIKKEIKDLFSLKTKSALEKFIEYKLYRLLDLKEPKPFDYDKFDEVFFSSKKEDKWLLKFLALFISQQIPEKLNLSTREMKILQEINEISQKSDDFEDLVAIYNYFKNKDILSLIFYGAVKNTTDVENYLKIKDIKIETTGFDLKELGILEGPIYKQIKEAVLREKILNNGLKSKNSEIEFIKKHYC